MDSASIQGNDASEGLLISVLFILPFRISTGTDRIQMVQGLISNHLRQHGISVHDSADQQLSRSSSFWFNSVAQLYKNIHAHKSKQ